MRERWTGASDKPRCAGSRWDNRSGWFECDWVGTRKEEGKDWCHVHAPSAVEKRRERSVKRLGEQQAKADMRYAVERQQREMAAAYPALVERIAALEAENVQLRKYLDQRAEGRDPLTQRYMERIARLEAALERIANGCNLHRECGCAQNIANAALREET